MWASFTASSDSANRSIVENLEAQADRNARPVARI
jgi:hypothetical protein